MRKYIFGYGSLMNRASLQKTLPGAKILKKVTLLGYQRKMNAPVGNYLYMNIVPIKDKKIKGVLIPISKTQLGILKKREMGYRCVNITKKLSTKVDGGVYTFIAPNKQFSEKKILKSYLSVCLGSLPKRERASWIKDTLIENPIKDDTENPKYANYVKQE